MTAIKATLKTKEPKPKTKVALKLSEGAAKDLMAVLNYAVDWGVGVGPTAKDIYYALMAEGLSSGIVDSQLGLNGRKQLRINRR